eukprot:scaffold97033_cov57-Phaeocystis_antarctica.AAC.3
MPTDDRPFAAGSSTRRRPVAAPAGIVSRRIAHRSVGASSASTVPAARCRGTAQAYGERCHPCEASRIRGAGLSGQPSGGWSVAGASIPMRNQP